MFGVQPLYGFISLGAEQSLTLQSTGYFMTVHNSKYRTCLDTIEYRLKILLKTTEYRVQDMPLFYILQSKGHSLTLHNSKYRTCLDTIEYRLHNIP